MPKLSRKPLQSLIRRGMLVGLVMVLAACNPPRTPETTKDGIFDPYEARNRQIHETGKKIDRSVIRPSAMAYSAFVPDGIEDNLSNFGSNINTPGDIINQVLQGRLGAAGKNTLRFGINSTLGFAGLADVAGDLGLQREKTDFGMTLAAWGVDEGPFVMIPLIGPSTRRHAIGRAVDFTINPLRDLPFEWRVFSRGAQFGNILTSRSRFTTTIDGVLYESVDSYTARRDIYLQNRAFELEQQLGIVSNTETETTEDVYDEIFGE